MAKVYFKDARNFIWLVAQIFNHKNSLIFLVNYLRYTLCPFAVSIIEIQFVGPFWNLHTLQKWLPLVSHLKVREDEQKLVQIMNELTMG